MKEKEQTSFERNAVALASLLRETDNAARKLLMQDAVKPADASALKNCLDQLNKYTAERRWEKDYTRLKNSIAQGEIAIEAIKQTLKEKGSDVQGQHNLLEKLKEKIGTNPLNRDLIEWIEQMQKTITPDEDKTGDILALEKTLEQIAQERYKRMQEAVAKKNMMDYLFVMVVYEQRLSLCILANPGTFMWSKLALELQISASAERERGSIFDFLGKQELAPAARKIHDGLCTTLDEVEENTYDFSTKESRRAVKKDTIAKFKKITKLEELCREALHEDSSQYKELMEAQNALLTDDAEEMPLREMQERLQTLQKAAQKYMEKRVEQGGIFGVPRREARLVYAAAVFKFAERFSLQLSEAMKCRDIEALEMPADMTKQYIQNSIKALDEVVKAQTGVDLAKERETPAKKAVLENGRQ